MTTYETWFCVVAGVIIVTTLAVWGWIFYITGRKS